MKSSVVWMVTSPSLSTSGNTVHAVAEVDDVKVMLKNLVLRQLALDETRDPQLHELAPERAAMITISEKAVVHDLHGDRAEALADTERPDIARERTHEAAP